jgi:hypothetical protein
MFNIFHSLKIKYLYSKSSIFEICGRQLYILKTICALSSITQCVAMAMSKASLSSEEVNESMEVDVFTMCE